VELHHKGASSGEPFCAYVPTVIIFLNVPINVDELPEYDEGCREVAGFLGFGYDSIPNVQSQEKVVEKMQNEKVLSFYPFNHTVSMQKML
jgi:hypothetical protein